MQSTYSVQQEYAADTSAPAGSHGEADVITVNGDILWLFFASDCTGQLYYLKDGVTLGEDAAADWFPGAEFTIDSTANGRVSSHSVRRPRGQPSYVFLKVSSAQTVLTSNEVVA